MKQCPECYEIYEDSMKFCDGDGTPLVDETTLLRAAIELAAPYNDETTPSRNAWIMGTCGVGVGIVLCLFFFTMMQNAAPPLREDESRPAVVMQSAPARPLQAASALAPEESPTPVESLTPEAEESETVTPSAPTALPNKTVPAGLNNGPVSTGAGRKDAGHGETVIRLKDGASVEVEAVWEDGQGVWYRRGPLVTFVERSRIEDITELPKPEASPTQSPEP